MTDEKFLTDYIDQLKTWRADGALTANGEERLIQAIQTRALLTVVENLTKVVEKMK